MLLTLTTTRSPATDLGYLLHKNPGKVQSFDVPSRTLERAAERLRLEQLPPRQRYQVERASTGPDDPEVGAPTLVAVFDRREARLAVPGQPSGLSPS